jgi:DNA polymerase III delta subunit
VAASLLVPLTVVVGDEELLVSRAVSAITAAARKADPEVDVRDVDPGALQPGDLADLLSPSLFAERRVIVLRAAQDLAKDVAAEVTAYAAEPLARCTSSSSMRAARRARRCWPRSPPPGPSASRRRRSPS